MEFPPPPTQSTFRGGQAPGPDRSSKLLIREYPHRAIAIVSQSHVLIFRHSHTTSEAIANGSLASVSSARPRQGEISASKCMVEFAPATKHILSDYRPLTPRPIYGTLGLISINQDVFLCVVTQASRAVATLRPGETIDKILMVEFFCLSSNEYDHVLSSNPLDMNADSSSIYGPGLSKRDVELEHPCQKLQELLGNGSFYYSCDVDLTNRLQDRPADATTFDIDNFDEGFLWNSFMISPLVQFRSRLQVQEREALDASRILTSAIRGFCSTMTIPQTAAPLRATKSGMPSYLTVISRLSCKRAGTRFNARGIDDDGNVANFVETETVFWSPSGVVFSYAQVRGSVPVFFEQAAALIPTKAQKITVTRSHDAAQPAFDKHFEDLEHAYGAVHVINLLSAEKPAERELTMHYRLGLKHSHLTQLGEKSSRDHALLRATEYDFHAETRGPTGYEAAQQIRGYIEDSAEGFAYYLAEETDDPVEATAKASSGSHHRFVVVLQQEGVFRTNCLDCLDRTNLIQTIVSQMAIESFLGHRGEYPASDFLMRHSSLWADNGDALSRIYAGTGALKSSFTRHGKMSFAGAIADARKSATRLYIQNFVDSGRQNTIDLLLGRIYGQVPVVLFDPISDFVASELSKRAAEFSSTEVIDILVGTFNLNGRTDGIDEDLSPWLWPEVLGTTLPELIVVGFQEIVELSPQQIMNSDPRRRKLWESSVARTLNDRAKALGDDIYVPLRSGQLVGAALCIFVKSSALHHIKNVESNVKKTGMSGIAGNKGAVAIRLDYANTPMCFVTAHLAAGFGNYDERNRDYAMIHQGLRFQRNRGIDDHSTVIWLGDFNYRIGLSREGAMELIRKRDLEGLYENDQLNLQMVAGLAFRFYSEARIRFMPTYRFDIGKDEYDSSEKQRIPAWTDRILRKGPNIQQQSYNSAPLKFSDHRPVYATFRCIVNIVDEPRRDKIASSIYDQRKADVGDVVVDAKEDTDDEELLGYDAIEPGLPPASSDRQKWWLDNGKMARSSVQPPKPSSSLNSMILNPSRASNPFLPSDEPDWVEVPRSDARQRSESISTLSTSPYEHVNLPTYSVSSTSGQQPPRKLPPPYDPSAFVNSKTMRMPVVQDANKNGPSQQRQETPPPPPPPRRQTGAPTTQNPPLAPMASRPRISTLPQPQSTSRISPSMPTRKPVSVLPPPPRPPSSASATLSVSRKPPTVARKPAHLSSLSPDASPKLNQSSLPVASSASTAQRHTGGYVSDKDSAPPKPPRRSATETFSAGEPEGDSRPRLPVRKPVMIAAGKPGISRITMGDGQNIDLLDDDGTTGQMASWQALKPE